MSIERIRLRFADLIINFVDRERALRQVIEWVQRVLIQPIVVFGPEGCGKSAWLKQVTQILKDIGFDVIYIDPLHRDFIAHTSASDVAKKLSEATAEVTGIVQLKLATLAIDLVKELLCKWRKRRVAVLVDDVFQAIGLDKAETYVKELLNLIEYPPADYEKIIAIVTTSEGVTRERIGRHRWADIMPMWNMSRRGFAELYEELPSPKPPFEDAWRSAGGNPHMLEQLYRVEWDASKVVRWVIESRKLKAFTASLSDVEKKWLFEAVEDPDTLFARERMLFMMKLVELNLVVDTIPEREPDSWVDEPPPEKDLEIGVGKYVAWQTPLHREAVKKVLKECG